MILRAARSTDAGSVGAILSEFTDTTRWMPGLHSRAEDIAYAGAMIDRGWVTVAEDDAGIAGFSALDGAEVVSLYVASRARGHGVGTQLLGALKAQSDTLTLWTFQANTGAQRFYARHGFVEVERTDGRRNEEHLPDIRYDWKRERA